MSKKDKVIESSKQTLTGTPEKVSPAFSKPKPVDQEARGDRGGQTNAFSEELNKATDTAHNETKGLEQEQHNTDPTYLNKWQNSNYATDGGQYGRWNGRNYKRTLRLAREADAYNNAPREHMFSTGTFRTGGVKDLGTGYDKPKLETMETRAMDQTIQLDTNQKQLAQALQDAVNHKDLNAFTQAYAQRYGIVLSKEQAEVAMRNYRRTQEIQQSITKDWHMFQQLFDRGFAAETAATLFNLTKTNELYAKMLSDVLLHTTTPAKEEMFAEATKTALAFANANKAGRTTPIEYDYQMAEIEYNKNVSPIIGALDYGNKSMGGFWNGQSSASKSLYKGA